MSEEDKRASNTLDEKNAESTKETVEVDKPTVETSGETVVTKAESETEIEKKTEETAVDTATGDAKAIETNTETSVELALLDNTNNEKTIKKGRKPVWITLVLAVLIVGTSLTYVLEKNGRIDTKIFSTLSEKMTANKTVAVVNGYKITNREYQSNIKQLQQIASEQGADPTDSSILANIKDQALNTLIDGELLRQEAKDHGIEVSADDINDRFTEIEEGVGGAEELASKMAEFGITKESLLRDIENDFLIQKLFEEVIGGDEEEVSDKEVQDFYDLAGGESAGLPPLEEVEELIVNQIKSDRVNTQIEQFLATLRDQAEIQIF